MSYRRWTPEEEHYLKIHYSSEPGVAAAIARRLGRGVHSVRRKAKLMGCTRYRTFRRDTWSEEEKEYLESLLGNMPFRQVYSKLNAWRAKRGLPERGFNAVKQSLQRFGWSGRVGSDEVYTLNQLGECLKSNFVVRSWLKDKELKKALKPELGSDQPNAPLLFHRKNLKAFFNRYPGEVARCKPDILWLIEVLR